MFVGRILSNCFTLTSIFIRIHLCCLFEEISRHEIQWVSDCSLHFYIVIGMLLGQSHGFASHWILIRSHGPIFLRKGLCQRLQFLLQLFLWDLYWLLQSPPVDDLQGYFYCWCTPCHFLCILFTNLLKVLGHVDSYDLYTLMNFEVQPLFIEKS